MGVHGLWELLAPVGRRVSVETLAGKKLAIDASIWMVQFMKAMRDDRGEMVRNAHLLGFFRRICKLLFLRTKPVFVFDGGTPALKRRTVIARRRQRENAQSKIRKTAEKLLLNHLKTMRLKELANELENQRQMNDTKGKNILTSEVTSPDDNAGKKHNKNQEALDEMLAASLAAEEDGNFPTNPSTSGGDFAVEGEEEDDEDEEMIVPTINGEVDPAILAALPPSMQLDLLGQMRERLMAENRQKYQKVKQAPAKFSELQIQSYLKTVAFRREIHKVQKSASGKVIGDGVQTSRIASEANREFIFSSSFTGDKRDLASAGVERSNEELPRIPTKPPVLKTACSVASTSMSGAASGAMMNDPSMTFNKDVETYVDERGRTCVSRGRAMGIRMTRDLQRNLDLMKEIEQDSGSIPDKNEGDALESPIDLDNPQLIETSDNANDRPLNFSEKNYPSIFKKGKSIEISFEDDGESKSLNDDDDLFAQLVAGGKHAVISSTENNPENNSHDPDSDFDWEEGPVAVKSDVFGHDQQSFEKCDTGDVEWGEGNSSVSLCPSTLGEASKGTLEEEADLQEAIRRSLKELKCQKSADSEFSKLKEDREIVNNFVSLESSPVRAEMTKSNIPLENILKPKRTPGCLLVGIGRVEKEHAIDNMNVDSIEQHKPSATASVNSDSKEYACDNLMRQDEDQNSNVPISHKKPKRMMKENIVLSSGENLTTSSNIQDQIYAKVNSSNMLGPENTNPISGDMSDSNGPLKFGFEVTAKSSFSKTAERGELKGMVKEKIVLSSGEKPVTSSNIQCQMYAKVNSSNMLGLGNTNPISGDMSDSMLDGASKFDFEVTADSSFSKTAEKEEPTGMMKEKIVPSSGDKLMTSSNIQGQMYAKENSSNVLGPGNTNPISGDISDAILDDASKIDFEVTPHSSFSKTAEKEKLPIQDSSDLGGLWEHPTDKLSNSIEITEALKEEIQNLGQERMDLGNEQRQLERNAESVSSEMFAECQELLQMFGLPYIIAPMEAEAQCAFLELANLVDGVVTDDSDAFLFGASHVYKNIFDERKYVETYFLEDIDSELGLSREKLIRMALLLGSDYTEGVSGIGIVNAIEVINAFPEDDGFFKFREWIESPDPTILGKLDVQTRSATPKKGSKSGTNNTDDVPNVKKLFMDKHRNVSKNWHIPSSFPSETVISAYAYPQVDKSTESFSWRKPDLSILRKLCWEKFGWSCQKADELLLPVLKEYNKHETQLRMEAFYSFNEKFAKIRSKRIKNAVKGIGGNLVPHSEKRKKQKANQRETMEDGSDKYSGGPEVGVAGGSKSQRRSTGKKHSKENDSSHAEEARNCEPTSKTEGEHIAKTRLNKRQRGISQQTGAKRKKKKKDLSSESNSDDRNGNETQGGVVTEPRELRKSTRHRTAVNYNPDNTEIDDELSKADEVCEGFKAQEDDNLFGEFCPNEAEVGDQLGHVTESSGYFKMGGGFCLDEEDEDLNKDPKEDVDKCAEFCPIEAEPGQLGQVTESSSYLKMGGGFCLEEEEEVNKDLPPPVQPETELISNQIGYLVQQSIDNAIPTNESTLSANPELKEDHNQQAQVRLSLRAMPNLRRKRRKS